MTKTDNENFADFLEGFLAKHPEPTYGIETPWNGETIALNDAFVKKQNAEQNVGRILEMHLSRMALEKVMEKTDITTPEGLKFVQACEKTLTEMNFLIQELWGFKRNEKYHRFWERPHCQCPKMDNDDRYPTGYYVVSGSCPLHGDAVSIYEDIVNDEKV